MKKPNFFIIGAPKCGTTSLSSWLSQHPMVYMSKIKEPHYYSNDLSLRGFRDEEEYQALFNGANKKHMAVGEASASYLFSRIAVPRIESEIKNARYIVLLRNPIEMAPSMHKQLLFVGSEDIKSFEAAWEAQGDRSRGRRIPKGCNEPRFLLYKKLCCLGEQVERLYKIVPKERILSILLDDMKSDVTSVWGEVLSFLDIPEDGRKYFPVENKAKEIRSSTINKIYRLLYIVRHRYKFLSLGTGILSFLDNISIREKRWVPLNSRMREKLVTYFESDIKLLQDLIGRDLSGWIK